MKESSQNRKNCIRKYPESLWSYANWKYEKRYLLWNYKENVDEKIYNRVGAAETLKILYNVCEKKKIVVNVIKVQGKIKIKRECRAILIEINMFWK